MATVIGQMRNFWRKSTQLHQMNDRDDLNLYYRKFLDKLSKICLKIFLPFLLLVYLIALFLCRLLLLHISLPSFDIRTGILLGLTLLTLFLLVLIRIHTKWKTL